MLFNPPSLSSISMYYSFDDSLRILLSCFLVWIMIEKPRTKCATRSRLGGNKIDKRHVWRPGVFHQASLLGLGAMLSALAVTTMTASVFYVSNNQPISAWSVQPTIYLAIASAASNILDTSAVCFR